MLSRSCQFLVVCIALLSPFSTLTAENLTEQLARSIMERKPVSYGDWHYETGTVLRGFEALFKATGNQDYYQYIKSTVDNSVDSNGSIANFAVDQYNLDQIKQGSAVLYLYAVTGDQRYAIAVNALMDQLDNQPQTSSGGNWHKNIHPNQIWLDGAYMAQPFNAHFGELFNRGDNFDDVVLQLSLMEQVTRDSNSGLLFHAWDESRSTPWADNTTGRSPVFWARAMGWYAMALVDVLDYLPQNNISQRDAVIAILNRIVPAIANVQDETGVWWQVADQAAQAGNWRESSSSAMFVYAIAKAVRKGYIEKSYLTVAEKGWQGLIDHFVLATGNSLNLTDTSEGTNVGASYSFYTGRSRETNDPKGTGPFLLAGVEMEFLRDNSNFTVRLEAEDQNWQNGTVDNNHQGYTGTGFVNTTNASNTWVDVNVAVPVAGDYTISVRYANGSTSTRPQEIRVDGLTQLTEFDMPPTDSWENWVSKSFVVTLAPGSNTIRFVSLSPGGAPNLDRFDISRAVTPENIIISEFAVVPSEPDGRRARLIALTNDGENLFAISSNEGKIYQISKNSATLWFDAKQALDGKLNTSSAIEGGVRSLAFHPDYANNGKFYTSEIHNRPQDTSELVYLSDAAQPSGLDSVVNEWTHQSDGTFSDPREVLRIGPPGFHTIKQIAFNPYSVLNDEDYGLLYIAHGDGGPFDAPLGGHNNNALGKVLRINPLQDGAAPYTVPLSNPFVGDDQMLDEVFALGFRSPHNLSFTKSGQLVVAEIGNLNIDEVNFVDAGGDYGWKEREGDKVYLNPVRGTGVAPLPDNDVVFGYTYPVAQLVHDPLYSGGIAIAGAYPVENGSDLNGKYVFGEFATLGELYYSELADMAQAVTQGNPEDLQMASTEVFGVLFDHDSDPATEALKKNSMLDIINDSPLYTPGSERADLRFGRGPLGEIYITSKQNNTIYLVENSVPPVQANDDTYSTDESTLLTTTTPGVLGNDTSGLLLAIQTSGASNGVATLDTDGSFTYLPDNDFSGLDTFTYQATIDGIEYTNEATVTITVTEDLTQIDDTDPISFTTSPISHSVIDSSDTYTIEGTATDDSSGVNVVRARVERINVLPREYWNGAAWQTSPQGTYRPVTLSGNTWKLEDVDLSQAGDYRVRVYAVDQAGNRSSTALNVTEFTVGPKDTTKPTGTVTSPATNSIVSSNASFTIAGKATDNASGVSFVRARVERISVSPPEYWNGTAWQTSPQGVYQLATLNGDDWTLENIDLSQAGNYRVRIYARDHAGNQSSTALNVTEFTVGPEDTTKPIGTTTNPAPNSTISPSTSFTIRGTATDNLSGVNFVRARVQRISVSPPEYWNGAVWQTASSGTFSLATLNGNNWTLSNIDLSLPGSYRVILYARDNAGNQSSTALNVIEFHVRGTIFDDDTTAVGQEEYFFTEDDSPPLENSPFNLIANDADLSTEGASADKSEELNGGGSAGWVLLCMLIVLIRARRWSVALHSIQ